MKEERVKEVNLVTKFWVTSLDYSSMLECRNALTEPIFEGQKCSLLWVRARKC